MNIHLITNCHLEKDFSPRLGGLDVYIDDLVELFSSNGYNVYVHDASPFSDYAIDRNNYHLFGYFFGKKAKKYSKKNNRKLMKLVRKSSCYKNEDLVIFSTDYLAYGNIFKNSIAIQHGIAWDVPFNKKTFLKFLKPILLTIRKIKILRSVDKMICVDYNYLNWLKGNYPFNNDISKITTIPNYSRVSNCKISINKEKKIVFARRFWKPRGTDILIDAIKRLSNTKQFSDMVFFIAGEGEEETKLKNELSSFENVRFEKYCSGQGVEYHIDKDIALIPTSGSEGTSLSALEAMSAGCAVICTSVGGLSNIVIDNYNGLLIKPNGKELAEAILKIMDSDELLLRLKQASIQTIKYGFSKELWNKRWLDTIEDKRI